MLIPITERWSSLRSPWEIYQALSRSSDTSFFLDSIVYREPDQAYSYIGMNPFLELTLDRRGIRLAGEVRGHYPAAQIFSVLRRLMETYRSPQTAQAPFFQGGAVGFWSYELAEHFEKIKFRAKPESGLPLLWLGFYRDLVVFDHKAGGYHLVTHLPSAGPRPAAGPVRGARTRLKEMKSLLDASAEAVSAGFQGPAFRLRQFRPQISRAAFVEMVRRAKRYIREGDIYQANLSQKFNFDFEGSALRLYEDLRSINPSPFSSFLKKGDLQIVSSSPERLVRKRGRRCETRPIAGTRPRPSDPGMNAAREQELFLNEKERAEHIMLVDLERNDLGRVCDFESVRVEEMMTIERYSHVLHLVSRITGRMRRDRDGIDLIRAMFPGGTITGCPKVRCMQIIDELEPEKRGLYTGSVGYLDYFGNLDLNIVIRTIVLKGSCGSLQVGAGIVHDSDPEREYEETLHKGEALTQALVRASL